MISSQDFRNSYEDFYRDLREYLWPYSVLEELAEVEVDIFTSFIDFEKLQKDFKKLSQSIKEALAEDELLSKSYANLSKLIENEYEPNDQYLIIQRVEEVNPDEDKQIRTKPEENEDSEELNEAYSFAQEEDQG